ncbi:MAG: ComF family protein [Parahaliea sp.]
MKTKVNKCIRQVLNGLFPETCLLCKRFSGNHLPLCKSCHQDLQPNHHCCQHCALPLPADTCANICGHCLQRPPPLDSVLAPFIYQAQLAHLVSQWKYHPQPRLGRLLAELWLRGLPTQLPVVDVLLPVPLNWRKLLERGFNQSAQLATLARKQHPQMAHLPLTTRLVKRRHTQVQAGLDAQARQTNLRGAFTMAGRCDNLRIALVDDVMTTGATANELAHTLRRAGAREVHLWCLARTPAPAG